MIHDAIIEIKDLVKHYGYGDSRVTVIRDLSLSIKKGETVAIVGPSGAGKSTLLNIAGCLDTYQKGKVSVLSKDVPPFSVDDMS
ncbi:MAG: ATP-binding cassette domain-containing protein, partial [Spirochaetota bacterium]